MMRIMPATEARTAIMTVVVIPRPEPLLLLGEGVDVGAVEEVEERCLEEEEEAS